MDLIQMFGSIGFISVTPALVTLYVVQFYHTFALLPLLIGILVQIVFAVMVGAYWVAFILCLGFIAGLGRAILAWEAEYRQPVPEFATTVEILPWLADSGAFQRSLNPDPEETVPILPQTGRHRQKYIRHRGDESVHKAR